MRATWKMTALLLMGLSGIMRPALAENNMKAGLNRWSQPSSESLLPSEMGMTPEVLSIGSDAACVCGTTECSGCGGGARFFAGADYLYVQPHFSEAIAYVRGTQTFPVLYQTETAEIDFDYDPALRAFVGYRLADGDGELKFTYWNMDGDFEDTATATGGVDFIVDPFGLVVGTLQDPVTGAVVPPNGDEIFTWTSVDVDIYDIDLTTNVVLRNPAWELDVTAGARIADVEQEYGTRLTTAGAFSAGGLYFAEFFGAGPKLGFEGRRVFGRNGNLTLHLGSNGSLLMGDFNLGSVINPAPPVTITAAESMLRVVPVLESEVGGSWRATDRLTVSSGWFIQSWIDLGASGGTFGGFFAGNDDGNIMSFDGFFVRGELAF